MRRRAQPPNVPPVYDWQTTDQEEIDRRKLRAEEGRYRVENLEPHHAVHASFRVSGRESAYVVEVRDASKREAVCECVDFRVNGLGTCKHAEAVWLHLYRRQKAALRAAFKAGSDRWDVVPDRTAFGLTAEVTLGKPSEAERSSGGDILENRGQRGATDPA